MSVERGCTGSSISQKALPEQDRPAGWARGTFLSSLSSQGDPGCR